MVGSSASSPNHSCITGTLPSRIARSGSPPKACGPDSPSAPFPPFQARFPHPALASPPHRPGPHLTPLQECVILWLYSSQHESGCHDCLVSSRMCTMPVRLALLPPPPPALAALATNPAAAPKLPPISRHCRHLLCSRSRGPQLHSLRDRRCPDQHCCLLHTLLHCHHPLEAQSCDGGHDNDRRGVLSQFRPFLTTLRKLELARLRAEILSYPWRSSLSLAPFAFSGQEGR